MAKEPDSRKQPDEEKDDFLDDIEEIDLDALLAEDDGLVPPVEEKKASSPAPAPAAADTDSFLDSEVLDLGSGEDDVETISADDLLDIEDAPERPQPVRMDSATNGNEELSSYDEPSPEEMPRSTLSSQGSDEEAPAFDLLDDLPAPEPEEQPIDLLADAFPLEESASEPAAEVARVTVEEETRVLADASPAPAEEPVLDDAAAGAAAAGGARKTLKRGTKALKGAKKSKEAAAVEAEAAPAKPAKSPKKKAREKAPAEEKVAVSVRAGSSIPFVCSECYEEFLISSSYPHDMVSCPECLHVGKKPDAEFIRTIHVHKAGEKRSLLAAVACGMLLAVVGLALIWMNAPGTGADKAPDGTTNTALFALAGLLTLCLIWLVARFEGNRWEVYF